MHRLQWMVALGLLVVIPSGTARAQPADGTTPEPGAEVDAPPAPEEQGEPDDASAEDEREEPPTTEPSAEGSASTPRAESALPDSSVTRPVVAPVVERDPAAQPGPVAAPPSAPPPPPPPLQAEQESESSGIFAAYTRWYDDWLERVMEKDLWGQTAQLPAGLLKLRYKFSHARAAKFYSRDGDELPLIPSIVLDDCAGSTDPACQATAIEPRVEGMGNSHEFQIAYGITDPLDVWIEIPFQSFESTMDLRLTRGGQAAGALEYAIFEQEVVSNGRPLPNKSAEVNMALGDIRVGSSWNFYRTPYFSAVFTPSVFLPTGSPANPDNDLTFLRGTEIDSGVGAWAVDFTTAFDVRPVEWFTLNFEVTPAYRFGYTRDAPSWLPITNCKRLSGPNRPADCASNYDPVYDLEQAEFFPDLEGLDDTYYVYPNMSVYFMAGFTIEVFQIPFQFGYAFNRGEATTIKASGSGNSGPNFEKLVRSLELLEATEVQAVSAGVQIPLLPLYIPLLITPTYTHVISGRNTIKLADQYAIAAELFLPVGDAF